MAVNPDRNAPAPANAGPASSTAGASRVGEAGPAAAGAGPPDSLLGKACTLVGGIGALLFAGVTLVMLAQALARAARLPIVGGDEVSGWMSASAAFCALPYAFREGALIRMELFLSRLGEIGRRKAELFALSVGTLWCGTMAFAMTRFVWQNAVFGERSTGLISIPIWTVQAPAAVSLVLLALAMAEQLWRVWRGELPLYQVNAESLLASDQRHTATGI